MLADGLVTYDLVAVRINEPTIHFGCLVDK